jgi:hypothetical protein
MRGDLSINRFHILMKTYIRLPILSLITAVFCAGCATSYTPNPSVRFEAIREFSSRNSIALLNGQPSTEKHFFTGNQYGNLNEWTNLAIKIASRELSKRGMTVKDNTPKSLTLSIVSAKTNAGWVMINSDIVMTVRASNGCSKTYTGNDFSAMVGNPLTEMDTALMKVVAAMLNDPEIVAFLTK